MTFPGDVASPFLTPAPSDRTGATPLGPRVTGQGHMDGSGTGNVSEIEDAANAQSRLWESNRTRTWGWGGLSTRRTAPPAPSPRGPRPAPGFSAACWLPLRRGAGAVPGPPLTSACCDQGTELDCADRLARDPAPRTWPSSRTSCGYCRCRRFQGKSLRRTWPALFKCADELE